MDLGLENWALTDVGATGLLVLVVLMILTGRLVPARHVKAKDLRIENLERANTELSGAVTPLVEAVRTNNALIEAVLRVRKDPSP